jgi:hypothetical protein
VHAAVGVVSALATVAGLLLIARRLRGLEGWQDLARFLQGCAVVLAAVLLAYAGLEGRPGGGLAERVAVCAVIVAFAALAHRSLRLAPPSPRPVATQ